MNIDPRFIVGGYVVLVVDPQCIFRGCEHVSHDGMDPQCIFSGYSYTSHGPAMSSLKAML